MIDSIYLMKAAKTAHMSSLVPCLQDSASISRSSRSLKNNINHKAFKTHVLTQNRTRFNDTFFSSKECKCIHREMYNRSKSDKQKIQAYLYERDIDINFLFPAFLTSFKKSKLS